jgi:hypothetical protein
MSNTGRNKKLASFNCDEGLWGEFIRRCQEQGTTATATLTQFIELYLDGKLDNLDADMLGDAFGGSRSDHRFAERIRAIVDEYLQQHLPSHLDKYLATNQDKQLYSTVIALSEKIGSLEARLSTTNARTYPNKTNPSKEREFWFIQDRARYLGVSINADQRLKIEMFANANYQERHGQLPKRQPYRGNQAFAYPAADVDILDANIRGVVKQG